MGNRKIEERGLHDLANTAINLMRAASRSPTGAVRSRAPIFERISNDAADALAALILGEDLDAAVARRSLASRLKEARESTALVSGIGERWIVLPALGLGNDLNPQAGGGPLDDKGTSLYPGDPFTNSFPAPTPGADFEPAFGNRGPVGEAAAVLATDDLEGFAESRLSGRR